MVRKLTRAADSCGRIPIFRLRLNWRTKFFCVTIHCPSGRIGWLRYSMRRRCQFRMTFPIGPHL